MVQEQRLFLVQMSEDDGVLSSKYHALTDLIPRMVDHIWDDALKGGWVVTIVVLPHKVFAQDFVHTLARELEAAGIPPDELTAGSVQLIGSYSVYVTTNYCAMRGRGFSHLYYPTSEGFNTKKKDELEVVQEYSCYQPHLDVTVY